MCVLYVSFGSKVEPRNFGCDAIFGCVVFLLFYCLLDTSCSECDVISLYFMCCSVNGSVCLVCCVFDNVCEMCGETICNVFGCGCYFVAECMDVFSVGGGALLDRLYCMVFQRMCVLCL